MSEKLDQAFFGSKLHELKERAMMALCEIDMRMKDRQQAIDAVDKIYRDWYANSWWYRVTHSNSHLPLAIDAYGFEKHYDEKQRRRVRDVIDAIDLGATAITLTTSTCSVIWSLANQYSARVNHPDFKTEV